MKKRRESKEDISNRLEILYMDLRLALDHFPHNKKYTLGGKIEDEYLAAVSSFFSAKFDKGQREERLLQMRGHLHLSTFLLRVAKKSKAISEPQYEKFSGELNQLGKIVTSWIEKGRNNEKAS